MRRHHHTTIRAPLNLDKQDVPRIQALTSTCVDNDEGAHTTPGLSKRCTYLSSTTNTCCDTEPVRLGLDYPFVLDDCCAVVQIEYKNGFPRVAPLLRRFLAYMVDWLLSADMRPPSTAARTAPVPILTTLYAKFASALSLSLVEGPVGLFPGPRPVRRSRTHWHNFRDTSGFVRDSWTAFFAHRIGNTYCTAYLNTPKLYFD
jgi:hypothetical protein